MSITYAETETSLRPADPFKSPTFTRVHADPTWGGKVVATIIAGALLAGWGRLHILGVIYLLVLFWSMYLACHLIWNQLNEPVVRLSATKLRVGHALFVECILAPKSVAEILQVEFDFVSYESYGESSHTETYPGWQSRWAPAHVGAQPLTVEGELRVPEPVDRRWPLDSDIKWHLALTVVVAGGFTVRRRYPIYVIGT